VPPLILSKVIPTRTRSAITSPSCRTIPAAAWRMPPLLTLTRTGDNTKKTFIMCAYRHQAEPHLRLRLQSALRRRLPRQPQLQLQLQLRQQRHVHRLQRQRLQLRRQRQQQLRQRRLLLPHRFRRQRLLLHQRLRPDQRPHPDPSRRRELVPLLRPGRSEPGIARTSLIQRLNASTTQPS
jgi:hypothetical protein